MTIRITLLTINRCYFRVKILDNVLKYSTITETLISSLKLSTNKNTRYKKVNGKERSNWRFGFSVSVSGILKRSFWKSKKVLPEMYEHDVKEVTKNTLKPMSCWNLSVNVSLVRECSFGSVLDISYYLILPKLFIQW